MPIYSTIKTYRSGFYNNRNDGKVYDAVDIRKPYNVIYSDGIKPDHDGLPNNNLKVNAYGGMKIAITTGFAKLGGAWFENNSSYIIELDAPVATNRYDCVILRNDDSEDVRDSQIYIKSLNHVPTIEDLTRDDLVYEVCIGYVTVTPTTTNIAQSNITDTRVDGQLCNVMSGVGATVVRTLRNTYYSESENQSLIPIGINQFDRTRDILNVMIEGRITTAYSIRDNDYITLNIGLPVVHTKIDFEVIKNVNAASAETVVQEVAQLRSEVTANNNKLQYDYYCNGVNDNEMISYLVVSFLKAAKDDTSRKFNIIGQFGYSRAMTGSGTSSNPYNLFDFILDEDVNGNFTRHVTLDFTSCNEINFVPTDKSSNVIFKSQSIRIVGANVRASNNTTGTVVRVFNSSQFPITCENCRFWITGYQDSIIARNGTFINCRGSITNTMENSYCFNVSPNGVLNLIGGEYYSYVADFVSVAAIVGQSGTTSVAILNGVSAPTKDRSGLFQSYAIYQMTGAGYVSCYGLITKLSNQLSSGQSNIAGTIPLSKEGLI